MDRRVILVTGAARSGKSEWAETLATKAGKPIIYIATSTIDDGDREWLARIEKHRDRRPPDWLTLEVPIELSAAIDKNKYDTCLLIDSLGTWVANTLDRDEINWRTTYRELLNSLSHPPLDIILVAEETGWGLVPPYPSGRLFRDRLGGLTRGIGKIADRVYLVVGGHALDLAVLGERLP